MKYHSLFLSKTSKMSQNLLSAAVVNGALMVKGHKNLSCTPALCHWLRGPHICLGRGMNMKYIQDIISHFLASHNFCHLHLSFAYVFR